jgi:hypothetical protein
MKKNIQTILHTGDKPQERGNCFPAVISCFMDLDSAEDAIQIQRHYHNDEWSLILYEWLTEMGYEQMTIRGHLFEDEFYTVSGVSPRDKNVHHICIYQNGELYHDPHPDGTGIKTEEYFSTITKL